MGNPLRGEAVLKADGKDWTLVFDVNVFCALEDDTGLSTNEILGQVQGNPSFRMLRSIVCAGLQPRHPGTTKLEAGEVISGAGAEETGEALRRAIEQAMPPPKKAGPENPPTARRSGTG